MNHIINNNQTRPNRLAMVRPTRQHFEFNNGYNRIRQPRPSLFNISNTSSDILVSNEISSSFQYNLFNSVIDISANNLSSELIRNSNPNRYYSTFEYDSLNIRFFHNESLNSQNIAGEIENVLNSINEREIQNLLNEFQINEISEFLENEITELVNNTLHNDNNTLINSQEIVDKIYENITVGEYFVHSSILKNHTCPILLTDFEVNDVVSIFNLCNHAIHVSTCDKYIKTFTKCPLCNNKLFEL